MNDRSKMIIRAVQITKEQAEYCKENLINLSIVCQNHIKKLMEESE
jgi:hypothetical protein